MLDHNAAQMRNAGAQLQQQNRPFQPPQLPQHVQQQMPQQFRQPQQFQPPQQPWLQQPPQQQFQQQQQSQQKSQQQLQQEQQQALTLSTDDLKLPEQYDTEDTRAVAAALLTHVNGHYQPILESNQSLQRENQQFRAVMMQERQQSFNAQYKTEFESGLTELGAEWEGTFGAGDGNALPQGGLQLQNRSLLDNTIDQIRNGRAMHGQSPMPVKALQRQALRLAFSQQHDSNVVQSNQGAIAQRRSQFTSPPTRGNTGALTQTDVAIKNIEAGLRGLNVPSVRESGAIRGQEHNGMNP